MSTKKKRAEILKDVSVLWRTTLAKMTPPSCPKPSLMTQFSVAASGRASLAPMPMAHKRDCIDRTPPAEDSTYSHDMK